MVDRTFAAIGKVWPHTVGAILSGRDIHGVGVAASLKVQASLCSAASVAGNAMRVVDALNSGVGNASSLR